LTKGKDAIGQEIERSLKVNSKGLGIGVEKQGVERLVLDFKSKNCEMQPAILLLN
jgi:hypothetical protein